MFKSRVNLFTHINRPHLSHSSQNCVKVLRIVFKPLPICCIALGIFLCSYIPLKEENGNLKNWCGKIWALFTSITAFMLICMEIFEVKLKYFHRRICYFIIALVLCEVSTFLWIVIFIRMHMDESLHLAVFVAHIIWYSGAILYTTMNSFNHIMLIYFSIQNCEEQQQPYIRRLRVQFIAACAFIALGSMPSACVLSLMLPAADFQMELFIMQISFILIVIVSDDSLSTEDKSKIHNKLIELIRSIYRKFTMWLVPLCFMCSFTGRLYTFITRRSAWNQSFENSINLLPYAYIIIWAYFMSYTRDFCMKKRAESSRLQTHDIELNISESQNTTVLSVSEESVSRNEENTIDVIDISQTDVIDDKTKEQSNKQ